MPNASGKVDGKTSASQAGTSAGDLVVLEAAGEGDAPGGLAGELGVALRRIGEERARCRSGASSPPSSPRPRVAISSAASTSPSFSASHSPSSSSRKRPEAGDSRRAPGFCAWTSGHAASSRSTPFETISLPTKTTRGPVGAREPLDRHGGLGGLAVPGAALVDVPVRRGLQRGEVRRQRPQARRAPRPPRPARTASVSTPGGPGATFAFTSGSSTACRRRSAMCSEPTRIPAAARMPSSAYGRKRSRCGRTV